MAKAHVLVVDDDPARLSIFRFALDKAGYTVSVAASGGEGLQVIRQRDVDCVLSDIMMPGMSGLELLDAVRQDRRELPFVMITAYGSDEVRTDAERRGASAYIDGVWDFEQVLDVLGSCCDRAPSKAPAAQPSSGPSTRAWIDAVQVVVSADVDVPDLARWARLKGTSISTLRKVCFRCGVTASDSLDCARAVRCAVRHKGTLVNFYDTFEISEPRTMVRFLDRCGLSSGSVVPPPVRLLRVQRFVTSENLLRSLEASLK